MRAADHDIVALVTLARMWHIGSERWRLHVPQRIARGDGGDRREIVVRRRRRNRPLERRSTPGIISRDAAALHAPEEIPETSADAEDLEDHADGAQQVEELPTLTGIVAIDAAGHPVQSR